MGIRAVFFDIDNTLYDSATLSSMARRNSVLAMIDAGLPQSEDKVLKDLEQIISKHGSNYPRHYDELLRGYGMVRPKIIAAGVVAYEHTKNAYLKPFPGVLPTLLDLKKSYSLGVISNGLALKQWEKLVGLRLHHFFESVVTSEQCGCEKPSPKIFEEGLKSLGVLSSEALMVGDSIEKDIAGAVSAGMHAVRFTKNTGSGKDEISSFSQIPHYIKGLKL